MPNYSEPAARMKQMLDSAKKIALTADEHQQFMTMNMLKDFTGLPHLVAKISERTGIPLSSGRIAHDAVGKCLLVVD